MIIGIVCTNYGIPIDVFMADVHNSNDFINQRMRIIRSHFPNCRGRSTLFDEKNFCRKWHIVDFDDKLYGYVIYQEFTPNP